MIMHLKTIQIILFLIITVSCMISAVSAAGISYSDPGISINVSESLEYPAIVTSDDGQTPPVVNYTSSNSLVAGVDSFGNITGYSAGSAMISAEIIVDGNTLSASVVVDVADSSVLTSSDVSAVSNITVYADYSRMPYDSQSRYYPTYSTVSAEVTDADGNLLPGEEVTWEVSDPSVASVVIGVDSKQSFIKPVGPGATEIRARSVSNTSIVSANQSITVFVPWTNNVRLYVGSAPMVQHQRFGAEAYSQYVDDMFTLNTDDTLEWIISNTSVIAVEQVYYGPGHGSYSYVTALAPGTSTIQVKSGTNPSVVSDIYTITVLPFSPIALVWDFTGDTSKLNLTPGSYWSEDARLIDSKGFSIYNTMMAWSSSNATVFDPISPTDGYASLHFNREGVANLTVQSVYYPNLTNTTQFVVSPPVFSIQPLSHVTTNRSVYLDMVNQFGNSLSGVTWSVSDPSILVDSGYGSGSYYVAKPGEVTVTGKVGEYPSVSYTFTVEEAHVSKIYGYISSYMNNGSSEGISAYAYNQYNEYLSSASFEWHVDNESVLEVIPPHDSINPYSAILRAHAVGTANLTITDPNTGVNVTNMIYVEDGMYRPVLSSLSVSMSPSMYQYPTGYYGAMAVSEENAVGDSSAQLSPDGSEYQIPDESSYWFEGSGPVEMSSTVLSMAPMSFDAGTSSENTVYLGSGAYVYANTLDQLGQFYADDILWSVSDSSVLCLNQESFNAVYVCGKSVGTAVITGTSRTNPALKDSITLTVVPMPALIQVNVSTHANISVSDVVTADAVVIDTDGNPITDAVVTWSSSDSGILNITNIDGNQVIFAAERPGTASISASYQVSVSSEEYTLLKTTYTFTVSDYVMPLNVLALNDDWNFVSVPVPLNTSQNTAQAVFSNVDTDNHSILEYNSSVQVWVPLKADTKVYTLTGYWIYSQIPTKVNLSLSTDPVATPPGKQLYTGWNAIGLNNNQSMEAKNMLSPVKDAWVSLLGWNLQQSEWDTSIINGGTGQYSDLRMVNTGWGYWVYVTKDAYLTGFLPSVKV